MNDTTITPEQMQPKSTIYEFTPCVPRHTFVYEGHNTGDEVPDGTPCQCGATVARWEPCPTCGERRLRAVPIVGKEPAA